MSNLILSSKPLIEAIFELQWKLEEIDKGFFRDPDYKIIIGQIFEKVEADYPFHQELPTAKMPDEFLAHVVQHQFRRMDNGWPLIQLGPGIVSLNDTEGYLWSDFEQRIAKLLEVLFELYSKSIRTLRVERLLLRYIDAVEFDYEHDDIFEFLKGKMKTTISLNKKLFDKTAVKELPKFFDLRFSFPTNKPAGIAHLRFVSGKKEGKPALIWETQVFTDNKEIPNSKDRIKSWIREAHDLTHDWFFKMIEGELFERFNQ